MDIHARIAEIEEQLDSLPKGTLTYKRINGKEQPYLQRTVEGRNVSVYIKVGEREQILMDLKTREDLLAELNYLKRYVEEIRGILRKNPYLDRRVSTGFQNFYDIMAGNYMYVDKTAFLKEWWERPEQVSLITRPRRFGKTLMISVMESFFSCLDGEHPEYFEKLSVWKDAKMRKLYGALPVIRLSFGSVKGDRAEDMIRSMCFELEACLGSHFELLMGSETVPVVKKEILNEVYCSLAKGESIMAERSVSLLAELLTCHFGRKPIILLDEYDTPLTEAYASGVWDEVIHFFRRWFHMTFKENGFFRKALITGVTRVAKNSLFSDMNNVCCYSCTDPEFGDSFGFTEQEVMDLLQCQDVHEMERVKTMYDGFSFGSVSDIYNPWSISSFMKERDYRCYWINTGSNEVIGDLIRRYSARLKADVAVLLEGKGILKRINEDIAFQYLDDNEEAFWSLLLATGYICAREVKKEGAYTECQVEVTNREAMLMFEEQVLRMFPKERELYDDFVKALLKHRADEMQAYLSDLAYSTFSYFDTGRSPQNRVPENFYHGLFLGLVASLRGRYHIRSNRESGFGRYDVAMVPSDPASGDAFLVEFKVRNPKVEKDLQETVEQALRQIDEKQYVAELLAVGVPAEKIYKIGIVFDGKAVEVGVERASGFDAVCAGVHGA